jgi:hypothetical protein
MSEGIKWERSRVRKNRFFARVGEKKVVLFLYRDREWLLAEDGKRRAGIRKNTPNAEAILREIAEHHYTHGHAWQAALEITERKAGERIAP